jgi:S-adenosylmethionine-diacylglycerol 3-amino-3-carboxypropyl transferase
MSVHRLALPGARSDRLFFAQVREDPRLEIEALRPSAGETIVIVGSGGCTALSLLASGAGRVVAVDLNRTQNHLIELKAAAIATLPIEWAWRFLGVVSAPASERRARYTTVRTRLSPAAAEYWDSRQKEIGIGALNAGVSERFIALVVRAMRLFVHRDERIRRLLACTSLDEQRALYETEWNSWRWKALFQVLMNRVAFRKAYDPAFFKQVENPSFAAHFHGLAEHALTRIPVADNYFLHHMLTGVFPVEQANGVPVYLSRELRGADHRPRAEGDEMSGAARAAAAIRGERLTLVDGAMTDYLRTLPAQSVHGIGLSNICEWLVPSQIDELFAEVARVCAPGARVCFRNFVGWTEVPARWRHTIVEDRALGERLMSHDRSVVQRRLAVCDVRPVIRTATLPIEGITVRIAEPADNDALLALTASCAMRGDIDLCITRSPDFFALNRLEGERWRVAVAESRSGEIIGCIMVAERSTHIHGVTRPSVYIGDLKVHPRWRGMRVADALSRWAHRQAAEYASPASPTLITVLAGNRSMEWRTGGRGGVPPFRQFARIRSFSVPLLWRRRADRTAGINVAPATGDDLEEMTGLWSRVAATRQFTAAFDASTMQAWIEAAPSLDVSDYRVARRRDGRIAGFVAWWDQSAFKQLRVERYSRRLRVARTMINGAAGFVGATALPPAGGALRFRTALHLCVPVDAPDVFRALVLDGYRELRAERYAFANIGLDAADPLCDALHGLHAQPTDINAYVTTADGGYEGPPLDDRPLHYEIALV